MDTITIPNTTDNNKRELFIAAMQSLKSNAQNDPINIKEVQETENYFYNYLDDDKTHSRRSDQCYSRAFIEQVIKYAKKQGHSVPKAMFNLRQKADGQLVLWCTYDKKALAYSYQSYDFASKDDALAYKEQLLQLKQQESAKTNPNEQLLINIDTALKFAESQLKEFGNDENFLEPFMNRFTPINFEINKEYPKSREYPNLSVKIKHPDLKKKNERIKNAPNYMVCFTFDIFASNNQKVAHVNLILDRHGSIQEQHTTYYGPDGLTIEHIQAVATSPSHIVNESFKFMKTNESGIDTLTISESNRNVIGVNSTHSEGENDIQASLRSSLFTKPNNISDYLEFPYKTQGLDNKLLRYKAIKESFITKARAKQNNPHLLYTNALNSYKNLDSSYSDAPDKYSSLEHMATYLSDEKNDLLKGFSGNFIGSIFEQSFDHRSGTTNPGGPLIVATEHTNNTDTYRCYYVLKDHNDDTIKAARKSQRFITKVTDGEEKLLFYFDGTDVLSPDSEITSKYNAFKNKYIAPFSDIKPVNLEQYMLTPTEQGDYR